MSGVRHLGGSRIEFRFVMKMSRIDDFSIIARIQNEEKAHEKMADPPVGFQAARCSSMLFLCPAAARRPPATAGSCWPTASSLRPASWPARKTGSPRCPCKAISNGRPDAEPEIVAPGEEGGRRERCAILVGTPQSNSAVALAIKELGLSVDEAGLGDEGYVLKTVAGPKRYRIIAAGNGKAGRFLRRRRTEELIISGTRAISSMRSRRTSGRSPHSSTAGCGTGTGGWNGEGPGRRVDHGRGRR